MKTKRLCLLLAAFLGQLSFAYGQTEEMRISDSVQALEEQLRSASFDERDEAEKEIVKLGPACLDFISDPSDEFEDDYNQRLVRVRKQLEQLAISEAISPTKITLSGKMSIKMALNKIKRQTGNVIALAEGYDEAYLNREITLDLKDATYWTALADISARGGLDTTIYGSVPGQTTVVPKAQPEATEIDQAVTAVPPPLDESGIFRIRVANVSSARNLIAPGLDYTRVELEIQWEPRLSPISIEMPLSEATITDSNGKELKISNSDQVLSGIVQPGINQVELSLTLENVDRSIASIGTINAKLDCVLPGRREKFKFAQVGSIEGEPQISKAGVTVQYLGFEQNEDLYAVNMRVAMETDQAEFASHLGWIYDNPLYLVNEAGQKESSIGHQGGNVDEDGVTIQYFFIEEPTTFKLLYESPGAIVSVPAKISLKDIPLP